tara:strand:- start:81238 stop:82785 length:1548 start_codon:yes stop_codon:yes gene_type:complete
MPRKQKLTYQKGSSGRGGRWRKKYRGATYYFPAGNGKTDRAAYEQALEQWSQKKAEIDAQVVKPHEDDYRNAIIEWNAVLNWSTQHGDQRQAKVARSKMKELQAGLCNSNPRPLAYGDRITDTFEPSPADVEAIAAAARIDEEIDFSTLELPTGISSLITPRQQHADETGMTADQLLARLWQDRIDSELLLQTVPRSATVEGNYQRFKEFKVAEVAVKEISAGRYANLIRHVDALVDFVGGANPVTVFNERVLTDYRTTLQGRIGKSEISGSYAKDRLDAAKQFVRWLWRQRVLEDLPRVIDDKQFNISASHGKIMTFTKEEIRQLLGAARGRHRLHILLTLNSAFTQKDISDLKHSEVCWKKGTISRKRSKTSDGDNVPEVTYTLWPETLQLLKEFRSSDPERLLVNENGSPLKVESLRPDGKLYKVDNIQRNFARLCRRLKISGRSFTCLKKTSATLLRGEENYSGLESYFLGHAPRSMGDKHYSGGPDALLAKALKWLRRELQIDKCLTDMD